MIYDKIYCNLSNMQLQFVRVATAPTPSLYMYCNILWIFHGKGLKHELWPQLTQFLWPWGAYNI